MSRPAQGAAFLDKKLPSWYKRVKRPINLASYSDCVGAQISGDFAAFVQKYFTNRKTGIVDTNALWRLGFHTRKLDAIPGEVESLNVNWQREIDRRVAAAAKPKEAVVV
jgi:hypothetical protein